MKKSFIKRNTKNTGFTLVETLVAIAILMIAIAGPLTVAEKGLSAAIYARDKLIGSYLAQDGMEAIKNIVDTNELNGNQQMFLMVGFMMHKHLILSWSVAPIIPVILMSMLVTLILLPVR